MTTEAAPNLLVLTRHGESEWNKLNLFTGWKDPALSETGIKEAKLGGERLKSRGYKFDIAFTSALQRAQKTCQIILEEVGEPNLETIKSEKLNERYYGDLQGLNKDDARKKWGAEQVQIWRRSYDIAPPNGESLKDTAERVLPYYKSTIVPHILKGEKVLIAAHGNSLRALIMDLEGLTGDQIVKRELATGVPIVYHLDKDGKYVSKELIDN
ncbi:Phosphoglycerate mutase [Schizosaccharomyces pombe]|uniref:Phosphoglycerate mutase n=1 Tax=Schizosaccharomyces pombe (strain 972 / ATCC 24843) TaxID=284812 RepID=PMGY_SCHPO|nr:monomeric 2,3-bisphosphoglycerate (BPG)-dependent phosphoglycerate mutase (PGAM), Gpm1 [Schizosaccharomyces pombe]P36623.1 RecName: Full=Phosphoglycerate mutase; Short=PGAM; AltName: Full=BPG-dependent PGAM; AltName: Full=MPGM; AltName: Full=Phosphoglyceromutase [Schizosaccharomyces pombe 972h-]1FZT_A Chain A, PHOSPHOGLYCERATE MUTASE [Schizosaccharomyces pombe]CAA53154.1 phosphoglycerate mutase [Schizosaccharomyces pombe]CAA97363.1 monomeric 2,3-bisphosphoglycerate (BPG)-dependent phosphogly|eukprot:NP_594889.1 monomeric 2,3-bisphosphoglycerate (BPG)-dependent phosphoglycerate mutase (PGAM), Gpm1 [Schizosaccharomyces pombe]